MAGNVTDLLSLVAAREDQSHSQPVVCELKKNGGRSHRLNNETKPLGDSFVSYATLEEVHSTRINLCKNRDHFARLYFFDAPIAHSVAIKN